MRKTDEAVRPEIRRIVAVEAHRRRTGRCPLRIHSLGTGESFDIQPTDDGFVDLGSDLRVAVQGETILLPDTGESVILRLTGGVGFEGYDHASGRPFTGRAGGGASVTIYDPAGSDFFQYAVATAGDRE